MYAPGTSTLNISEYVKEMYAMDISATEISHSTDQQGRPGTKLLPSVLTDLKQRGIEDILIACIDCLKGFPEAIEAVYSKSTLYYSSDTHQHVLCA